MVSLPGDHDARRWAVLDGVSCAEENDTSDLRLRGTVTEMLVQRLPANPKLLGECHLRLASLSSLPEFDTLLIRQRRATPTVCSSLLRESDPLPLAFTDQGALELCERSHYGQQQRCHR